MKSWYKKLLFMTLLFLLSGCTLGYMKTMGVLQEISSQVEIMYNADKNINRDGYRIGTINLDGSASNYYYVNREIVSPTWSADGNILFFLSRGNNWYEAGYPAYWDKQSNSIRTCKRNLPLFFGIESANNPDEPYEALVQNAWEILRYNIRTCEVIETILDHTIGSEQGTINGFSYNSMSDEIVFSENKPNQEGFASTYNIIKTNLQGIDKKTLAQGVNPKWSPDGSKIAYIGTDGVYVMDSDGGNQTLLWGYPFGDMWRWRRNTAEFGEAMPRWSFDGDWLVFHVRHNERWLRDMENVPIILVSVENGSIQQITTGGIHPVFIPKSD